ncbi:hypothetical protein POSPLADRAFT_1132286 [Postia placenta MAD-698-R-SB12]|uniref:Peptidase S28 n=1 Tax=Postia placenta MAD-698-R-SB12 TaxID=670580 RepID=A0A1X6NAU6_9APHY|nr:hypothetical protein POSPLADRAFT_1132286 [Postia placenta MAD-698-R-SB12]OSX65769.1 hypothetical protein POSPLADRAFT_1132286 [Postia placenta MAD-698-R-SB12]
MVAPVLVGTFFLLATGAAAVGRTSKGNISRPPVVPKILFSSTEPVTDHNGAEIPPYNTQRYWHTWEFYEPGGPIILTTPGEENADGYEFLLTDQSINGLIAQQQHGATIVLEHRYYGYSNPYIDLSTESLRYHTIQQAIDDLEYFAYNVELAMPGGNNVTPADASWILTGCSYAGALTSFPKVNDYWGYFDIVRQFMPQNCSADVQAVISYIDEVVTSNDAAQISTIKEVFNMDLTHLDDFAYALARSLYYWQDLHGNLSNGYFYSFCDALEVVDGVAAGAEGQGLDHALQVFGSWLVPPVCGSGTPADECLGTYDPTSYVYTDINNAERSWMWIDGAPEGVPTIVSRLITPAYIERQCTYYFPEAFSAPTAPRVDATNAAYGGWFVQADRLFFANGKRDPWRDATVSADGTDFSSTSMQPIAVGDGFHCSDYYAQNAQDPTVAAVQNRGLAAIKEWLSSWTPPTDTCDHKDQGDINGSIHK